MAKQDKNKLIMSFDPSTIEHLGVKMYSKLPNAIAELIANAYDADASVVNIKLYDNEEGEKIIVEDNGVGMSFEEINDLFLRIGRNRRKEGLTHSPSGKRKVTGKKGLGKLALFGIGSSIRVETIKENAGQKISFTLEWEDLISTHDKDYEPKFETSNVSSDEKGTTIILTKLQRKSSFDKEDLANSLSKLFNFFDTTFKVVLTRNDDTSLEIDNKLKYSNLISEFKWPFSRIVEKTDSDYELKNNINGTILSTEKPLKPGMRGITLFSNGRMVNSPEFFGVSESSHGYSYFTGWLEANYIDDWDEDVISTHRQSINWELENPTILRAFLLKCMIQLEKDWKDKRSKKRRKNVQEKTNINIPEWYKKVPKDILRNLEPVINKIVEKSELEETEQTDVLNKLHSIVPEYTYYHYRYLHSIIQDASKQDYINKDFYRAFLEAAKRYINNTRAKTGSTQASEASMMGEVFGENKLLSVAKRYKKLDGSEFTDSTKKSIEEGQKFLSMGIVQGGRNPVTHEEIKDLRDSDLFSEKDCLDGLSLLSHLMKRLENSENNE